VKGMQNSELARRRETEKGRQERLPSNGRAIKVADHWHVYSKRPFGDAEQAVRYLGHYTHRVRHLQPSTRFLGR
jgi:hypothetical protein